MAADDQAFFDALAFTLAHEGGLSDDVHDRGGLTHYGMDIASLRDIAKSRPHILREAGVPTPITRDVVRGLTREQVGSIFRREYWDRAGCPDMPARLGMAVFDYAVHSGVSRAVRDLQRLYREMHPDRAAIAIDGVYGPETRRAAMAMGGDASIRAYVTRRRDFLQGIVQRDATQERFLRGWMNRVRDLMCRLGV